MGGAVSAVGSALATGVKDVGGAISSGAKALYGDAKNYMQSGNPAGEGNQMTTAQQLLFGQQQPQVTAAQRLRQAQLMNP